jgi:hypothetical protein
MIRVHPSKRASAARAAVGLVAALACVAVLARHAATSAPDMATLVDRSAVRDGAALARTLEALDGVIAVDVDGRDGTVLVWHRPSAAAAVSAAIATGARVLQSMPAAELTRATGRRPSPTTRRSCCGN